MKKYNIALVGMGGIGKVHAYSIASLPYFYSDCGFTAVPHTLVTSKKNSFGFLNVTDKFEDVLNNPEIDIVDICTPNTCHYAQAKAALLAGKHVFCEKPLAVTSHEAEELADIAKKKGLVTGLNFQNRYWAGVLKAKELIDSIGEIITFRAAFLHSSSLDKDKPYAWRYAPVSEGGGVINDLASHVFDMLYYLIGEFDNIKCMTKTLHTERSGKEVSSDDAAFMAVSMKCGAVGTVEATKLAMGISDSLRFEIHGSKGAVRFDTQEPNTLWYFDGDSYRAIDTMQKYPAPCNFQNAKNNTGGARAHIHAYFEFVNAVHTGKSFYPDFNDGAYIQKVIEKAYLEGEKK